MDRLRNIDRKEAIKSTLYLVLLVMPIACGLINQLRMLMSGKREGIYIFVDPPGYIYPEMSLEFTWWVVLVLVTAIMMVITYTSNLRAVSRTVYPLYAYLVFLLVLVKPVF